MFKIRTACLAACYSTNSQMFWNLFIFHGNLHRLRSTGFDKQQGGPGFKFKRENVCQFCILNKRESSFLLLQYSTVGPVLCVNTVCIMLSKGYQHLYCTIKYFALLMFVLLKYFFNPCLCYIIFYLLSVSVIEYLA